MEQPVETAPVSDIKQLSGHEEGEQLADGSVVRADRDQAGTLVGWHKETGATEAQQ
jgi:hypothetical protein